MKCIVVGLGNFGSALSLKLMEEGHEVIGVDTNETYVNQLQDKLTHTLVMDTTNELAIAELPLEDTDVVIVGIGENVGASVTSTALFKKYGKNVRIIGRAISKVHETILEAMGVTEVVNPESDFAHQFANRLVVSGSVKSFVLDENYEISEVKVPESFIGKTVNEVSIVDKYKVSLVTILCQHKSKNILGKEMEGHQVSGVVNGSTVFKENDRLVLFGSVKALKNMMSELSLGD
ncbi:potassium channel family protein [Marinoscillum sp.]|uniref:potassium channel family protein n=1 Tax=Marinoscillum sp. TaxID=2024838 RepID=UPI003BA9AFAE